MILKNKTIVVTGASDGIGKQVALKLAQQGVNLALIARNEGGLKETQKESEKRGAKKVKIYPCDLRHTQELKATIKKIVANFGNIDILLNIAGIWQKA